MSLMSVIWNICASHLGRIDWSFIPGNLFIPKDDDVIHQKDAMELMKVSTFHI